MFKHARIGLISYILALAGQDDAYTIGRDWGIGVISKSGHAQKRQRARHRNLNSDPPVPLIGHDSSWPESQIHLRGTGYESTYVRYFVSVKIPAELTRKSGTAAS
jgi:hypothetical protein